MKLVGKILPLWIWDMGSVLRIVRKLRVGVNPADAFNGYAKQ